MVKNKAGIYQFSSFLEFENVIHGFSTRSFGSFRQEAIRQALPRLTKALIIPHDDVIFMEQVHGSTIAQVSNPDKTCFVTQTDGMVTKEKSCFLCVRTADCIPILAFDPTTHTCGVAHAGWKGALSNIAGELVRGLREAGNVRVEDIIIGIGPSIRVCCYSIDSYRAELFITAFPEIVDTILEERGGVTYLNLQKLVITQLKHAGVLEEHIEDSNICTHDSIGEFFSYRDKKSQPGLFAGIMGIR